MIESMSCFFLDKNETTFLFKFQELCSAAFFMCLTTAALSKDIAGLKSLPNSFTLTKKCLKWNRSLIISSLLSTVEGKKKKTFEWSCSADTPQLN